VAQQAVVLPRNATWQFSQLNAKTFAKDLGHCKAEPMRGAEWPAEMAFLRHISSVDQSRSGRSQMLTAWSTKINFTMEWPLQSCGAADQCPCACLQPIVTAAAPPGRK
jgi:hypothetical protein